MRGESGKGEREQGKEKDMEKERGTKGEGNTGWEEMRERGGRMERGEAFSSNLASSL